LVAEDVRPHVQRPVGAHRRAPHLRRIQHHVLHAVREWAATAPAALVPLPARVPAVPPALDPRIVHPRDRLRDRRAKPDPLSVPRPAGPGQPVGGATLEWRTTSPPPHDNFATTPVAGDPYDVEAWRYDRTIGGFVPRAAGDAPAAGRERDVGHAISARHEGIVVIVQGVACQRVSF